MKKYKYVVTVGCSFTVDPPHNSNELFWNGAEKI